MSLLRRLAVRAAHLLPRRAQIALKWRLMIPDMGASLLNMKRLGFEARTVIDVGAFDGQWTLMGTRLFPDASFLMCEPLPEMRERLETLAQATPGVRFEPALLGAQARPEVPFFAHLTGSSIYESDQASAGRELRLPMTTLAALTDGSRFAQPDLIKIDVQGAELQVLSGGEALLASCQAVILEVSLVREYEGCPLIHEVVQYMVERGFHVYDVCTIWRNTPTGAMNQADVIFVPRSSPLLDMRHYSRAPRADATSD